MPPYPHTDGPNRRLREQSGAPEDRFGLTGRQAEALAEAWEMGYFDVPPDVDLDDVADRLGVTHPSLSGRMSRGQDALVESPIVDCAP